jgi:hypothetical protein
MNELQDWFVRVYRKGVWLIFHVFLILVGVELLATLVVNLLETTAVKNIIAQIIGHPKEIVDYYFFWQPYIAVSPELLTTDEQNMLTDLNWIFVLDEDLVNLFSYTYEYMDEAAGENKQLFYLADVFAEESAQFG